MKKGKITILKKLFVDDIVEEYLAEDYANRGYGTCECFEEGEVFVIDEPQMPEGFCSWAWADIQRDVVTVMMGGSIPWFNQPELSIVCCTDGLRPVIFKIEAIN